MADKHFRPLPRPGHSRRRPFPAWVEYKPNSIWIYDTTHFTKAKMAVLIIQDLVSRKWITEVVSADETSTQVEVGFTDALQAEGLLELVERRQDGLVDLDADDENRPILLAVSIAQHFGHPGTPTDQAWVESFNGHLKVEFPQLLAMRAELAVTRAFWNAVRLHAGIGYVTPNDEHEGRGEAIRKARQAGLEQARNRRLAWHRQNLHTQPTEDPGDVG